MKNENAQSTDHSYQIGTVATLTGLDPHTIRAWERRYGAIRPSRSETGRRRYDDETVERLQLLKALVDCHESIGSIATLPAEELRERLEKLAELGSHRPISTGEAEDATRRKRVAVMAPGLEAQLRANAVALPELELVATESEREALLESARRQPCEIIVLELESLGPGPLGFVQACRSLPGSPLVVVLYRFAPRASLARLAQAGARLIQTPVRLEQLRRAIRDQLIIEQARGRAAYAIGAGPATTEAEDETQLEGAPARRFDDDQLARLFEVSSGIDCECPNHLSSLVSALVAFETYSQSCESRDEADARLHRRLAAGTAQARAQLESLLSEVCEREGIAV